MRRILFGDLVAAAAVLAATDQADLADQMLTQADAAHRYVKHFRRPHPFWGDGSLMSRALAGPRAPTDLSCPRFLQKLAQMTDAAAQYKFRNRGLDSGGPTSNLRLKRGADAMAESKAKLATVDPVWARVRQEAFDMVQSEPLLGGLVHSSLLHHPSMERALAYRFSMKLASGEMSEQILREIADEAFETDPDLGQAARADLTAVYDRDPACLRFIQPMLFFKGYQAVQAYRIGHWLWGIGRKDLAYFVQMRVSEVFGVDIHPAARIGRGIMIDHAHSIVVGETAVVGDNVSMLHSVTLGGTGKEDGDRHPKIGNGVMIGAGAAILGNIHIGQCSRIAAGSVVLIDVPANKTVAGVPARIVGEAGCAQPSVTMDQLIKGEI